MKTICLRAVTFITSLILLSGCDDNTQENNFQNNNEVRFESAMTIDNQEKSTKITQDELNPDKSKWEVNDKIGVLVVNKESTEILSEYKNLQFRALESNNATAFEAVGEKIYYPEDGKRLVFKAYYPFIDNNEWQENEVAIDLTDQTDLSKLDLLYATANNGNNGYATADQNTPVSLVFKHQLSMLSMSIASSDNSSLEVKIQNTPGKVLFDVKTGLLKTEESSKESTFSIPLNKKNNKYESVLSSIESDNAVLIIKQGDKEYKHELSKTFATLKKGKKHKLNITIKNGMLANGNIEEWGEENGEDVVLGNEDINDKEILLNLLKVNNELLQAEGKKLTVCVLKPAGPTSVMRSIEEANWAEENDVTKWKGVVWKLIAGKLRVVEIDFDNTNIKKLSSDFNKLSELAIIDLCHTNITDISPVSGSMGLKILSMQNCDMMENIELQDLPSLELIDFEFCLAIKKVNLNNMPKLETLDCTFLRTLIEVTMTNMNTIEYISFLECDNLEKLSLNNMNNLRTIDLSTTNISDLSFLSKLKSLKEFYYFTVNTSRTITMEPLVDLDNLEFLAIGGARINDISGLSGLHTLKYLDIKGSKVSNLTPLAGLNNLESLIVGASQLNDISSLSGLPKLKSLSMYYLANTIDLSPISGLANLSLTLYNSSSVNDISFVSGLSNLKALQVTEFNNLSSINLSGMTNLTSLNIGQCALLTNDNIRICGVIDWENIHLSPSLATYRANIFCH
ncbi:fimbrillin family protein [Dysgonomonas sp. ZJ279]|uniref:fimbrillin family protein n=1 Tax=Dysgonomonas sp. ZJ279 TaxID=2709796 RepID=UPI0013EDC219|nr:fimbrillin family protein [Dysgonomonas sp. ZJ279]